MHTCEGGKAVCVEKKSTLRKVHIFLSAGFIHIVQHIVQMLKQNYDYLDSDDDDNDYGFTPLMVMFMKNPSSLK